MENKFIDEAVESLSTVLDMIRWGMSQFQRVGLSYGHGTDNPWDDALLLVLHALHLDLDTKPEILHAKLTTSEKRDVIELLRQRFELRKPVAYITHQSKFADLAFYVDERVLIPRSPIAELIESQFQPWIDPTRVNRIVDICTGSGCIAIAASYAFPNAKVDAIDLSKDALAVADMNRKKLYAEDNVELIHSDLLTAVKPCEQYDIIVSNPPYVVEEEMNELPAEYHHEPAMALRASDNGLFFAIRLLREGLPYLADDGILVVEVGDRQEALSERFPDVPFFWLEFARGGDGVFLLTKSQLQMYQSIFQEEAFYEKI